MCTEEKSKEDLLQVEGKEFYNLAKEYKRGRYMYSELEVINLNNLKVLHY
jgi:Cys-tRNA synthase (O-phospho-L-seryl-tRNA:Cys-tRNA synthase)